MTSKKQYCPAEANSTELIPEICILFCIYQSVAKEKLTILPDFTKLHATLTVQTIHYTCTVKLYTPTITSTVIATVVNTTTTVVSTQNNNMAFTTYVLHASYCYYSYIH